MKEKNLLLLEYNLQWFAQNDEGGDKTEPATAKKLKDARDEGKVVKSKELSAAVDLIALFMSLKIFVPFVAEQFFEIFSGVYNKIPDVVSNAGKGFTTVLAHQVVQMALQSIIIAAIPFLLISFIVAILTNILQVGWKVTTKPMQPKLSKINPISGFKRIFSKDSLFELVKSIAKIGLIAYVAYSYIKDQSDQLLFLYDMELLQAVMFIGNIILDAGLRIGLVYLIVGVADYIYQRHKFNEEMKMSKQEVKDEYKNTEGNPEIKGKQRQRMREASQRRMMQDVPKADVVITNPTHLAVAISYDIGVAKAPVVLAKGEDYLAMKIREAAKEHHIEIVENKPLARMLYTNVDIGAEIPPELYQAVAEVLAMLHKYKK